VVGLRPVGPRGGGDGDGVSRRQIASNTPNGCSARENDTLLCARSCCYEEGVSEITTSTERESGAGEKVRGDRAKKRSKQKRINALPNELKVMFL